MSATRILCVFPQQMAEEGWKRARGGGGGGRDTWRAGRGRKIARDHCPPHVLHPSVKRLHSLALHAMASRSRERERTDLLLGLLWLSSGGGGWLRRRRAGELLLLLTCVGSSVFWRMKGSFSPPRFKRRQPWLLCFDLVFVWAVSRARAVLLSLDSKIDCEFFKARNGCGTASIQFPNAKPHSTRIRKHPMHSQLHNSNERLELVMYVQRGRDRIGK